MLVKEQGLTEIFWRHLNVKFLFIGFYIHVAEMMKFFWNARYRTAEFDIFEEFERFLLL